MRSNRGWLWTGALWCLCGVAFWRCTERILPPEEACVGSAKCGDGGADALPPTIQPTPTWPNLGKACSKDLDCGTGLVCVKGADEAMRCHQDCSQNPLDCQKNNDGRTTCQRNESGQRFCFQPHAKEGALCGLGMHNDCDKRGAEPLYCDPSTWRCKKAAQTGRPSEPCDLPRGKGCLRGLSCLSPKHDGVGTCERLCTDWGCSGVGFSYCSWRNETDAQAFFCVDEIVEEGGSCSASHRCKSWLSLFCDEVTKTCKPAPRIGKKGDPCVPSAQGGGCENGLFCLSGRCAATCKEEPSLCALGEQCKQDIRGVWSCLPAQEGDSCEEKTKCSGDLRCDAQRKQCALPSRMDARLGEPCDGQQRIVEGLVCTSMLDVDFFSAYCPKCHWMQDCSYDTSICAKNADKRTACYSLEHHISGLRLPRLACLRLDAKEGEACGEAAQALCEDDDSQQPKLLCLREICTRPLLQAQEGAPCVGPFIDIVAFAKMERTPPPALCDRDATVPLVCDPKTKTCIKAGIVGEGQSCLGATGNLCDKGLVCGMQSVVSRYEEGICKRACDVRNPQCPQGSFCSRSGRFWPKIHTGVCFPK